MSLGQVFTSECFSKDFLNELLDFLDAKDIGRLSPTNKFMNSICTQESLWKRIQSRNELRGTFKVHDILNLPNFTFNPKRSRSFITGNGKYLVGGFSELNIYDIQNSKASAVTLPVKKTSHFGQTITDLHIKFITDKTALVLQVFSITHKSRTEMLLEALYTIDLSKAAIINRTEIKEQTARYSDEQQKTTDMSFNPSTREIYITNFYCKDVWDDDETDIQLRKFKLDEDGSIKVIEKTPIVVQTIKERSFNLRFLMLSTTHLVAVVNTKIMTWKLDTLEKVAETNVIEAHPVYSLSTTTNQLIGCIFEKVKPSIKISFFSLTKDGWICDRTHEYSSKNLDTFPIVCFGKLSEAIDDELFLVTSMLTRRIISLIDYTMKCTRKSVTLMWSSFYSEDE